MANVPMEAAPTCELRSVVTKHRGTPAWTLLLQLLTVYTAVDMGSPCDAVGHHMMQLMYPQ